MVYKKRKKQLFTKSKEDNTTILTEQAYNYCFDNDEEMERLEHETNHLSNDDLYFELDGDGWD